MKQATRNGKIDQLAQWVENAAFVAIFAIISVVISIHGYWLLDEMPIIGA